MRGTIMAVAASVAVAISGIGAAAQGTVKGTSTQKADDGMVLITGGTFTMGSPASERMRDADEAQHKVSIADFYCDPYEVRQSDWQSVMGSNPSEFRGADLPVECVSWYDAVEYCNKKSRAAGLAPCYEVTDGGKVVKWNRGAAGYRLLTEAEWEYAHRAGTTSTFLTPNYTTSEQANFYGCYPYLIEENYLHHTNKDVVTSQVRDKTVKVDSFKPNGFGLYNTAGNVAEWCFDLYGEYGKDSDNPYGAQTGYLRVARGGGYNDFGKHLRSAYRSCYEPHTVNSKRGFRICRNAAAGNSTVETREAAGVDYDAFSGAGGKKARVLVAYFSYSGNTEKAAKMIAARLKCDIVEIEMVHPYRGNIYDVSQKDLMALSFPALKTARVDMAKYDVVLLGYPTWWATMPRPVAAFVRDNDLSGKLVMPFSSHGGTVFGESVSDLAKAIASQSRVLSAILTGVSPRTPQSKQVAAKLDGQKGARVQNAFEFNYSGGGALVGRLEEWLKGAGIE